MNGLDRHEITRRIGALDRRRAPLEGRRHAAVTVLVAGDERDRACLVITRRAPRLRSHGGQWALPGGRLDTGEGPVEAALRETREEVGLDLPTSAVLGLLDDYPTRSGYVMTPVVAWAGDAPSLSPNPGEVESAHLVPLADLDVTPELVTIPESDRPVIRLPLFGRHVHAPTAAVIHQFCEVGLHGRLTRVDGYEQPVFAWR